MKTRVLVLYGGRSGEHEISLLSAASVFRKLDRSRYDVLAVGIDHQGRWKEPDLAEMERSTEKSLKIYDRGRDLVMPPYPQRFENRKPRLVSLDGKGAPIEFDVAFPVVHGPLCEDGALQGLFELADVPFVGCGVMASAIGMDKEVSKRLARDAGLPIVPYVSVKAGEFERDPAAVEARVERELGMPVFVKPVTMGSSVGVHKVKALGDLRAALKDAFRYDPKVLVEKGIAAREIELAALENRSPGEPARVSGSGEIVPHHEFYSYEAKYLDDNGAALKLPSGLPAAQEAKAREIAARAFAALECEGMARVDLFLDKNSNEFYLNEINTIPGFTSITIYPKMWETSGLAYPALLTELVELALARQKRKDALVREFHSG